MAKLKKLKSLQLGGAAPHGGRCCPHLIYFLKLEMFSFDILNHQTFSQHIQETVSLLGIQKCFKSLLFGGVCYQNHAFYIVSVHVSLLRKVNSSKTG